MSKIKLFVSDIDGTLTDSTVYYSEKGEELKQFSHRDGRGLHLLHHESKCKTMLCTSETKGINNARAAKFKGLKTLDYYANGAWNLGKIEAVKKVCNELGIDINTEVAFIGDDTNDMELLKIVSIKACPKDAHYLLKKIENIIILDNNGGKGAVREFIDYLFEKDLLYK